MDTFAGHTPTTTTPPEPRPHSLTHWERLMQRGSAAIKAGRPDVALFSLQLALTTAQDLLLHGPTLSHADDCVAALVVSHHNLAELCHQLHRPVHAVDHLCQAHSTLLALLREHCRHPINLALQQAAWRHSRETHAGLLLHQRQYGAHPAITALLRDAANPIGTAHTTVH